MSIYNLPRYNFRYDNWGTNPSSTPGTSVTPGASNAEGSWTQVASSGNIAQDCYWLSVYVRGGSTSGQNKAQLLDIGVDPAGGTSYTEVISNIGCGGSGTGSGMPFHFPFYIKAGSSVAVRVQGVNATAGTVRVAVEFFGQPSNPEFAPVGAFSETIGTIASSAGVAFTPGNAADGSWTSLGTTAKAMWWWNLAVQFTGTTKTAELCYVELATGDGSNKHIIQRLTMYGSTAEAVNVYTPANGILPECYWPVPAGATMYVRGRCQNAPDTGYNALAIGIGG